MYIDQCLELLASEEDVCVMREDPVKQLRNGIRDRGAEQHQTTDLHDGSRVHKIT